MVGKGVAHKTCFPIVIPPHDPAHSQVGTECMEFVRTLTDRDINCNYNGGAAEQLTAVTSFMDLSLIYGNSIEQNRVIREFQGGRMIVEERNGGQWLPRTPNVTTDCDVQDADSLTNAKRSEEHYPLTSEVSVSACHRFSNIVLQSGTKCGTSHK